MDTWECRICGYKFEGDQPPSRCPLCDAPDTDFVRITSRIKPVRFNKVDRHHGTQGSDLLQKFVEASLLRQEEVRHSKMRPSQEPMALDSPSENPTFHTHSDQPGSEASFQALHSEDSPRSEKAPPPTEQPDEPQTSIQQVIHPDVTRDTADELVLAFDLLTVSEGLMRTEWMEHAAALREIAVRYLTDIASRRCEELSLKNVSPLGLLPYLFSNDRAPRQLKLYLRRIIEELDISTEESNSSGDSGI